MSQPRNPDGTFASNKNDSNQNDNSETTTTDDLLNIKIEEIPSEETRAQIRALQDQVRAMQESKEKENTPAKPPEPTEEDNEIKETVRQLKAERDAEKRKNLLNDLRQINKDVAEKYKDASIQELEIRLETAKEFAPKNKLPPLPSSTENNREITVDKASEGVIGNYDPKKKSWVT